MYPHALNDAVIACEQALHPSFQPTEFASACQRLGNMLQGLGRFEEAMIWHTQASLIEPDFVQIYAGVGRVHILQGHWQGAAMAYEKALQLNPNFADAYWKLGSIAVYQGRRDRALLYWYHALALEPQKSTADGHVRMGNSFLKLGQVKHALACYRRAIRVDANYAPAYRQIAQVMRSQGKLDEAIATYHKAITLSPTPSWAYYELGCVFRDQKQLEAALEAFQQAINHPPVYLWAPHDAAELLLSQHRWQDAIALCQAILAEPSLAEQPLPWAYSQMGRALAALGKREEAIACHQTASELREWPQCKTRNYQFTQDWFTHNIPVWVEHLQSLMGAEHTSALEIGSFQGMSACWLLDHLLSHPSARLTCIDPSFQPEFEVNIAKTGASDKVSSLVGNSHQILPTLPCASFDLIYIDGCHLAAHVRLDGELSWPLLKPNGILIFDDYYWSDPNYPKQDPKLGIDSFLASVSEQCRILHQGYQIIVQKVSLPSC
jgi:tetratricopeptide (TPR) repeat protein/predicted O-methyltransferase YrrM